jgi:DNA polymerase elongation subunit (family B)
MGPFPRALPPTLCEDEDDLEFQIMDWYIPEADRAVQAYKREHGYGGEPQEPAEYEIFMHGVTAQGHTVCAKVVDFHPYFFVRMPDAWWKDKSDAFIKGKIKELKESLLFEKVPRKRFIRATRQYETYMSTVVPMRLRSHVEYMKLVWRKDFWGFTNGKDFPFLKFRVKSLALFQILRRHFGDQEMQDNGFKLYESNIDPFLRFIHERNIQPCGWVRIPAGTYTILENEEDAAFSRASYNISVRDKDVFSLNINKIAPLLIASFDIECTSSHGDFPVAKKDYRKLATDLLAVARTCKHLLTKDNIRSWVTGCFHGDVDVEKGVRIHRVHTKVKWSSEKLAVAVNTVVDALYVALLEGSKDVQESDAEDEEDAPAAFTNAVRDATLKSLLQLLGTWDEKNPKRWKGPLPELCGDPLIQIGTTVHRYGSDDIIYRHICTLKSCDAIEDADVETYRTEEEVILAWKELLQRLDPDILTGYNIFGFDMKYVYERAEEVGIADTFLTGLGRLTNRKTILDERKLSSSALGDNIMHSFDMDGVVLIDMLKVMQRDHKLDSYKLDHVASVFLGDNKDDLKPYEIFEKFYGTSADRCDIARYCLQDCALVNRLLHKLKVLENNVGMGNVCSVPLSYLFMRGQGVKIFSLVAKECRSKQHLIPVVSTRMFGDVEDILVEEDGYEGAIVLPPQEGMYLEDPITVLDYSSLYPSSMIARNLSHDCFVIDPEYAQLEDQGVQYLTVEYDVYKGTGDKKEVVDKKQCTFAQLPNNQKGIIPSILMKLLQQRKNTRKKIEYETLTLKDGRVATGLVRDVNEECVEVLNVDQADVGKGFGGHKATLAKGDILERNPAFNAFEQAVLDALQLAYKITANSLYGQIGSRTSPIYWKDIAACTTATGREMIMLAKNFVETQYGAEVVYGDSVMPHTPILLKHMETGEVTTRTIESIAGHWMAYDAFKAGESNRKDKEQSMASEWLAWTDRGWSPIARVIRHKCAKSIYMVSTPCGAVEVTEDHSLLDRHRHIVKPHALTKHTVLLSGFPVLEEVAQDRHQRIPQAQVFQDALQAQEEYMHLRALGYEVKVDCWVAKHKRLAYELSVLPSKPTAWVETITCTLPSYDGYVYDLETEEGVFQAGVGELIVKNTDSIFCKFPNKDANGNRVQGKDALPLAIAAGQKTSEEIRALLPPPQCLEYEKTFHPFILFSKKRYVGNLYEDDPTKKPKQKSMGIVLKRRDNAHLLKKIYGGIIDILLNHNDLEGSVRFLQEQLQDLIHGKFPLEDLIITKTLKADYKDPTKIAHKVLAERMGERDAGNKPMVNDRIPFVYIKTPPGVEIKLQGDRIEHPEYIQQQGLTPDYRFYITNQLIKPICQLYALCVEKLPGYSYPPGYWVQLDEELKHHKTYGDHDKKRKDRISTLKMRLVEELLFEPYLSQLQDGQEKPKRGTRKRAGTQSALPLSEDAYLLTVQAKEVKRGKRYGIHVRLADTHATGVYENTEEHNGVKLDTIIRGLESAMKDIFTKHPDIQSKGIRIVVDKPLLRVWKSAMGKMDTIVAELKAAMDNQDIGKFQELSQLQRMMNLLSLQEKVPYVLQESEKNSVD